MSIGISICFLAGRYHATPWDHQVNEGVVEFPPSPWRILRALVSAYYRLPETPPRQQVCQLLTRLAESLPSYVLPVYSAAHTRHYVPIRKEGQDTTTRILDTFLVLGGGTLSPDAEIQVVWRDLSLTEPETQLLKQLCRQVSYLGRAESWAELTVLETAPTYYQAEPRSNSAAAGKKVNVLVPLNPSELQGFQAAIAMLPKPKKGKAKWKAPGDVLEALELDVGEVHRQSWNGIPGTRWVPYDLREPKASPSRSVTLVDLSHEPMIARFALASAVLPKLTEAVSVGERFRQGVMSRSNADPIFAGRDQDGQPAKEQHHAWYLPEVNAEGRMSHLVVYAAKGFQSEKAIEALHRLETVWGSEGFTIQTVLLSVGQVQDYSDTDVAQKGRRLAGISERSPIIATSRKWRSLTPMVLPRYPKIRNSKNREPKLDPETQFQLDGTEDQALYLIQRLPHLTLLTQSATKVRCLAPDGADWLGLQNLDGQIIVKARTMESGVTRYPWQAFQRRRYHGKGDKFSERGHWLEVEFAEPQTGPIALGYAAHFGLGVFVSAE